MLINQQVDINRILENSAIDIMAPPRSSFPYDNPRGTSTGEVARDLSTASRIVASLSKKELQQIMSKILKESGEVGELKKFVF